MGQIVLNILAFLVCMPIVIWIIKCAVVDNVRNTYKKCRKETKEEKMKAIIKSAWNGLIALIILALITLCSRYSYSNDPYKEEKRDEYIQRNEPG